MSIHMLLPGSKATIMPATVNASHFSRFMVRVQLSPSSPRRLRLWEGGELLDIILSRGGCKFCYDTNIVSDCILSSPRCCTPRSQTQGD
ncbi:hypothetical protein Bca52824_048390 [Brassica carinata]|uniref:Uncharacterized protein n=1 Tax=Brassica carinata TaxID=52824 RepID=A0A8X7UU89_BRACI|nr:hypothetical protein Bca52824_048390 [Brassica carinata]